MLTVILRTFSFFLITLFVLSIGSSFVTTVSQGSVYVGPSIQGHEISLLNPNATICVEIFVPPRNLNMLYLIAQEVSNHQIRPLTRTQLVNMFGNIEKVNEVAKYLQSRGFTIVYKSPFALMVEAQVKVVESTFNVNLALYSFDNITYYRPLLSSNYLWLPPIFKGTIIGGLTNITEPQYQHVILGKFINGKFALNVNTLPQSSVPIQSAYTYYTPQDLEGAYNITSLLKYIKNDSSISVAVVDAFGDPEIYQDLQNFDSTFNLPQANLTIIPIGPYHPVFGVLSGWDTETALDVETVHAIDPYAHIYLVVASNDQLPTMFVAIDDIVSEDLAQIVSMSWGLPENLFGASGFFIYYQGMAFPNYPYLNYYFQLGNAEGITFFASSGDEGAYGGTTTTYGAVMFPASSPFVTSVGGTSLFINVTSGMLSALNSSGIYESETAWSVNPTYFGIVEGTVSSGGGYSTFFPLPLWQSSVSNISRALPDVSAVANPYTGFTIFALGQEIVVGGTSVSTPLWGGLLADIESYLNVANGLGNINPTLYYIYSNSSMYKVAFNQVTEGYNGAYLAKPGYNLVTGLGSPNAYGLALSFRYYIQHYYDKELRISVTTEQLNNPYPWYMYGTTFQVVAYITYPNGTIVNNGSFYVAIYSMQGEFPTYYKLSFNGTYWVTNISVYSGEPPNIWTLVVQGTSTSGLSGIGYAEVDIGESIGILEPVPFPYALSLGYNEPFNITVTVYYPNGTPVVDQTVSAYLLKDGSIYANLTLLMVKPGIYTTTYALLPPLPQGTYILEISSQYGEAYTYIYFGDMIFGGIITPVYDYLPSASPGNNITIFAEVLTPQFTGVFTSQVFASLISPKGKPIVNITLKPAPDIVLFGVFNLFFTYYGNLTVPNDVKPGFYNVIVYSETNSSLGVITGKFVTSLYISNYSLNVTVKVNPIAYEGQWLKIYANITYPNGTEVTEGSFTATIMPASLESQALVLGLEIGIPLQYNSTLNEWVGEFRVPSELQGSIYQGNTISWLSGPWAIFISGSAKSGQILISNATYFYVEPYTYLGSKVNLNQNARSLPPLIAKVNKTTYVISNVYIGNLTVKGVILELLNSRIGSIIAIDSKVIIKDNEIGGSYIGIVSINSTLTILNSIISNVIYAFDQINSNITLINVNFKNVSEMSKVPPPTVTINVTNITIPEAVIQFTIFGEGLRIINVLMNGKPVHYFLTRGTENEIIIDIPFNATILPDGVYAFVFEISNGGLVYNETKDVINTYHQILSNEQVSVLKNEVSLLNASVSLERSELISYKSAFYISSALAVIAIIIGVLGVIFIIRKR